MRRLLTALALLLAVLPSAAQAQRELERARIEWTTGYLDTGALSQDVSFMFDASGFGGPVVARDDGVLDVDPALWYGLRGTYRLNRHFSVSTSWMHSEGRYRATFPALASVPGVFDLEGYILATQDFAFGTDPDLKPVAAMSLAISDLYLVSASYEFTILDGWAHPYFTVGAGLFTQRSDGSVISLEFGRAVPEQYQEATNLGVDPLTAVGLSSFRLDDTDPAVSVGAGFRVAISDRWGVHAELEDAMRLGTDFSYIDATSTPPTDGTEGRFFSTTFRGTKGTVHNLGIRLGFDYAIWPFSRPR